MVQAERRREDVRGFAQVHRRENVIEHRHGLKQADVLERSCNAHLRDVVRGVRDDVGIELLAVARVELFHLALRVIFDDRLAAELDLAVRGLVDARDAVERGRFAGAVRADERDDLTLVDIHREVVDGHNAAKLHGDVFNVQNRFSHCARLPSMCSFCVSIDRTAHGRP